MTDELDITKDQTKEAEEALRLAKEKLSQKYVLTFTSGVGLDVLQDILEMCHFGITLNKENQGQVAQYNIGVAILAMCGIYGDELMNRVLGKKF